MTSIDNKELVVRLWYEELWNKWNLSAADELFSADYQLHIPGARCRWTATPRSRS